MTGGDVLHVMTMGAAGWAAGEAGSMLIGHAAGYITSGKGASFERGAFIYDIGDSDGWITFSNVIIGDYADIHQPMQGYQGTASPPDYFMHETGHIDQQTILGPAYLPAQAASLTVGAFVGTFYGFPLTVGAHRFGLFEHYWHPFPDPPR
jgi:hypothetical protein